MSHRGSIGRFWCCSSSSRCIVLRQTQTAERASKVLAHTGSGCSEEGGTSQNWWILPHGRRPHYHSPPPHHYSRPLKYFSRFLGWQCSANGGLGTHWGWTLPSMVLCPCPPGKDNKYLPHHNRRGGAGVCASGGTNRLSPSPNLLLPPSFPNPK